MKYVAVSVSYIRYSDDDGEHEMRVNSPVEPLPVNSVRNVFDAANNRYICYEPGDVLQD